MKNQIFYIIIIVNNYYYIIIIIVINKNILFNCFHVFVNNLDDMECNVDMVFQIIIKTPSLTYCYYLLSLFHSYDLLLFFIFRFIF